MKTTNIFTFFQLHKNRLKTLKEVPYTIKEAEAAGGLGTYPKITNKDRVIPGKF